MRMLMACSLVVLGLAGCGGSGGDGGADPATALPAGPVYLELVVNPEGDQRERMEALASKLLRTEQPGRKITELFESLDDTGKTDVERDIKPWLGERAGLALSGFDKDEPDFVVAIAAADTDAAAESLAREAKRESVYKNTDYWLDADETFSAVHGDFVLITESEPLLKRTIDLEEKSSLAKVRRFEEALARLPEEREGAVYFDIKALMEQTGELDAATQQVFNALYGNAPSTAIAVLAEEDQLALETRDPAPKKRDVTSLLSGLGYFGATPLVGELPGDSVVAVGIPDFGDTAKLLVNGLAGPLGGAVVAGSIEEELGIKLDRDVYGWIGDVAAFVHGDDVSSLGGGVLIEVRDRAAARSAVPRLLGALQLQAGMVNRPIRLEGADLAFELSGGDLPLPVYVALAGERVAITVRDDSAVAALSPRARLRESEVWNRAEGVLDGLDPAFVLDFPAALGLAEQAIAADPGYAEVKPYLEALSVLAAGSGEDGDERRSRLALGVE